MHVPAHIRCVIFDFDGVLVDSEPLHEWAIRQSVARLGWDFHHDRFLNEIVGKGDENAYRLIAGWNGGEMPEPLLRELLTEKWALMARGIQERKYTIQPGAEQTMLAAAGRGPVGVCSGSVGSTVRGMLAHSGLGKHVRTVVCADDVEHVKPSPEGYLKAATQLGVEPGHCMVIEDTPTGVRAGKAAGMHVIAVCHTMPAEKLGEADIVLPSIAMVRFDDVSPVRSVSHAMPNKHV